MIDQYRQKNDRAKMIEYGEKALTVDDSNITAMMVLSRNYAIEKRNLDRAVELGEESLKLIERLRSEPVPTGYTESSWKQYLDSTEAAAKGILQFAIRVKGR
jgi:hypothetical protein